MRPGGSFFYSLLAFTREVPPIIGDNRHTQTYYLQYSTCGMRSEERKTSPIERERKDLLEFPLANWQSMLYYIAGFALSSEEC